VPIHTHPEPDIISIHDDEGELIAFVIAGQIWWPEDAALLDPALLRLASPPQYPPGPALRGQLHGSITSP